MFRNLRPNISNSFITKYEQMKLKITKYEQNETYDPLDFKCLLLNTSKMKLNTSKMKLTTHSRFQMFITKYEQNEKGPIFQIVITKYEQNET